MIRTTRDDQPVNGWVPCNHRTTHEGKTHSQQPRVSSHMQTLYMLNFLWVGKNVAKHFSRSSNLAHMPCSANFHWVEKKCKQSSYLSLPRPVIVLFPYVACGDVLSVEVGYQVWPAEPVLPLYHNTNLTFEEELHSEILNMEIGVLQFNATYSTTISMVWTMN